MFPVAVVGNVDPQMPLERFSCQCARERDEESSLPLQMESGGPKWREFARNSPVTLKQENNSISMVYGGCAGSLKPTRLSLQFGELQGDVAQLQGTMPSQQQKTPCISVGWMGFSLIRGAGRTIILSRESRIRNTVPVFFEIHSRVINGHPIANEGCLLHPQERTCSASEPMSAKCH